MDFDFSKYDKENKDDAIIIPLTSDMLRRRVAWDVSPCSMAEEVIASMDLPPASEDVEETEHQEAHARLRRLAPVTPVIQALTYYAAEVIRQSMVVAFLNAGMEDMDIEDTAILEVEALHPLLMQSTMAVLSEMLDVKAININAPTKVTAAMETTGDE